MRASGLKRALAKCGYRDVKEFQRGSARPGPDFLIVCSTSLRVHVELARRETDRDVLRQGSRLGEGLAQDGVYLHAGQAL